jgi:RNA polymerase sigma-70 factor (ECF subfamily)
MEKSESDAGTFSSDARASGVDDVEAFDRLYRLHSAAVLRYALKCVSRQDIAEEITSDAFLALYRNLKSVDPDRLPAWLFTVARNSATSYWRRTIVERKYAPQAEDRPQTSEPGMLTSLLGIPQLKQEHRACLIMRYAHDLERAEIADRLGLSENQVKSYLQYGLELLRQNLQKEGVL